MSNPLSELLEETKLLNNSFHDYYLIERERKIQDTLSGEVSFHRKTLTQAFQEINDAIAKDAWNKIK